MPITGLGLTPEQLNNIKTAQQSVTSLGGTPTQTVSGNAQATGDVSNNTFAENNAIQQAQQAPALPQGQEPFKIDDNTRITADEVGSGLTTNEAFDFRDEIASSFQESQGLSVPTQREIDLDQDLIREVDLLNQLSLRGSQLEDELLSQEDFSEDRQVDIGTIRGEQAQAGRVASGKRRSLALEKQSQVNVVESLLNQKAQIVDNRTSKLANTRENISMLLKLSEATLPDVLQTQINEQTGEVSAIVRDPQTGAISTVSAGSITPEQAENATNPKTFTNALGQVKVWYTDANGEIVIQDLDSNVKSTSGGSGDEKAPSGTQFQAGTFATRMQQAEAELSGGRGIFVPFAPKFAKTEDRRLFEQAERNFINALLRRESGAAIADTEFDSARQQYIPLASDSQEVLDEKAQNRKIVFTGLKLESGRAFDLISEQVGGVNAFNGTSGTTSSGIKYTITQ